jgi:glycosyltransferase involved in cell wall biosynthesis
MQKKYKRNTKKPPITDSFVSAAIVINNDQKIIQSYLQEIHEVLKRSFRFYEIVIIDNGSTDQSSSIVIELQKHIPNVRLLSLSRQYELETAYSAGLENSIGDYVLIQDLNCDPPQEIPKMIRIAQQGYDIVTAVRKTRLENSLVERLGAWVFYWISVNVLNIHFPKNDSNFRVFSRRAVTAFSKIKTRYRYLRYFSATSGFSQKIVTYKRKYKRPYKARSFLGSVNLAMNVMISNSLLPLRATSILCMFMSIFLIFFDAYIFFLWFLNYQTPSLQVFFHSTIYVVIFASISVILEYLTRILQENKAEPLYSVIEEKNSSVISGSNEMNVV